MILFSHTEENNDTIASFFGELWGERSEEIARWEFQINHHIRMNKEGIMENYENLQNRFKIDSMILTDKSVNNKIKKLTFI